MNPFSFSIASFLNLGTPELLIILFIILLLFGGAKLPSLARGLGQSVKEFKKAAKDDDEHTPAAKTEEEPKKVDSSKAKPGSN
jgi:sec-independent protein translocase protein TatA